MAAESRSIAAFRLSVELYGFSTRPCTVRPRRPGRVKTKRLTAIFRQINRTVRHYYRSCLSVTVDHFSPEESFEFGVLSPTRNTRARLNCSFEREIFGFFPPAFFLSNSAVQVNRRVNCLRSKPLTTPRQYYYDYYSK